MVRDKNGKQETRRLEEMFAVAIFDRLKKSEMNFQKKAWCLACFVAGGGFAVGRGS